MAGSEEATWNLLRYLFIAFVVHPSLPESFSYILGILLQRPKDQSPLYESCVPALRRRITALQPERRKTKKNYPSPLPPGRGLGEGPNKSVSKMRFGGEERLGHDSAESWAMAKTTIYRGRQGGEDKGVFKRKGKGKEYYAVPFFSGGRRERRGALRFFFVLRFTVSYKGCRQREREERCNLQKWDLAETRPALTRPPWEFPYSLELCAGVVF